MTWRQFRSLERTEAVARLSSRILHNLILSRKIVQFCGESGIHHYRLSASVFPLITHPEAGLRVEDLPDAEDILKTMRRIGRTARQYGVSLSLHPSQYNVLASEKPGTVEKTVTELNLMGWFMDKIGAPRSSEAPINIHINRRGDPAKVGGLFLEGLARLSDGARERLVVENEDRGCWTPEVIHRFVSEPGEVPITFDFLHYRCNPDTGVSEKEAFDLCYSTWGEATPVFHYTESLNHTRPRSHCEYCKGLPPDYGKPYVCEIEAKMKDYAVRDIMLRMGTVKAQPRKGCSLLHVASS